MKSFSGLPTHYTSNKPKPATALPQKPGASSHARNLPSRNQLGKGVVFKKEHKHGGRLEAAGRQRLSKSIEQIFQYETNSSEANGIDLSRSLSRRDIRPNLIDAQRQKNNLKRVRISDQNQIFQVKKQTASIEQQLQQVLQLIKTERGEIQARLQQLYSLKVPTLDANHNTEQIVLSDRAEETSMQVQATCEQQFRSEGEVNHVMKICSEMKINPHLIIRGSECCFEGSAKSELTSQEVIMCQKLLIKKLVEEISRQGFNSISI